jgi:hypothetical protein
VSPIRLTDAATPISEHQLHALPYFKIKILNPVKFSNHQGICRNERGEARGRGVVTMR